MKQHTFPCRTVEDLIKAFGYAKRLLPVAKLGIVVNISQTKLQRSTDQNRYYWGVVVKEMADEYGCIPDEMHQILRLKFLKEKEIEFEGEKFAICKSTTKLKTDEFEEYLEKCRMFASMYLGIVILLPNESEFSY